MSEPSSNRKARYRDSGYLSCAMLLIGVVTVCSVVLIPVSYWHEGLQGILNSAVSALICLASGLIALSVASFPIAGLHAYHRMLLAMAFRLLPPLSVCLVLAMQNRGAESLTFVFYLLVFYMVTLSAETYLAVREIRSQAC